MREAGRRYAQTEKGRRANARRQKTLRIRRARERLESTVTHQGTGEVGLESEGDHQVQMEILDDSPSLAVSVPSVDAILAAPPAAGPVVAAIPLRAIPTPTDWQERTCSFCGEVRSSRFRFGAPRAHSW